MILSLLALQGLGPGFLPINLKAPPKMVEE